LDFRFPVNLGRQPLSYTHVWYTLNDAAKQADIGHVSSRVFPHTYRTWLDSQSGSRWEYRNKRCAHSDIRTTRNIYGDAITADMRQAQAKVAALALPKSLN
jgi:integrase